MPFWNAEEEINRDIFFDFDKDTTDSVLKVVSATNVTINITINITEAFDATKVITIGIPSDHSKFISSTLIDLTTIGVYVIDLYYSDITNKTISFFASGASATGKGKVYIKMLQNKK